VPFFLTKATAPQNVQPCSTGKLMTPYEIKLYKVIKVKGSLVTASRLGRCITRNSSFQQTTISSQCRAVRNPCWRRWHQRTSSKFRHVSGQYTTKHTVH